MHHPPIELDNELPVREGYAAWSSVYDDDGNPLIALEEPVVRGFFGQLNGREAIDIGCGTGRHTVALVEAGANVTAVDLTPEMMAIARAGRGGWGDAIRMQRLADSVWRAGGLIVLAIGSLGLIWIFHLSTFYFVVNLKKFETLNSLLCSSISSQCKEVTSAFLHISAMHASGIVLPDLRMTTMTTAAEQFTAAEQLSELVATRRANMSTATLRMASVSRAVGSKFCQ